MHWLDILIGGSSGTVILSGLGTLMFKQFKKIAAEAVREGVKDLAEDLAALKLRFASETGGNSNGLRQKVNEIAEDVAHLKGLAGQPK